MLTHKKTQLFLEIKNEAHRQTYQSGSHVLSVLLLAGGWVEDNVVYGLNELQLYHTLYEEPCKQPLVRHSCDTQHTGLRTEQFHII